MTSRKRLLGGAFAAAFAAAGAFATVGSSPASANSAVTPPAGITVPGDTTAAPVVLVASLEGRNEVTAGAPVGQALGLIGIHDNTLSYAISWRGIGIPSEADIHAGVRGVDGPVVVPLFTTPRPPDGFVSGTVTVTDPTLLAALRSDPGSFYTDLRTDQFPDGAVRAQFHLLNHAVTTTGVAALQESVVRGSQIYACTRQSDGSFAFTQHDVEARLSGGIHHTFVQPDAGPPQWQAPDGTAVTGKVVTKNANGDGNIAELNLDATQIGKSTGLLGHVVEVLRLNTVGGVAPAGACNPQATPTVNVPYQADYVFING
jgi:hypothetical protein